MTIQLLTNEAMVKGLMPVPANLAGEYLATAMLEAQELGLQEILGQSLLDALKAHETAEDWSSYPAYSALKEQCQVYLAYRTIQEVLPKVSFKICNAGAVQTSDTNVANLSREQIDAMIEDYSSKADAFAYRLQLYVLKNRASFAELDDNDCNEIRATLHSAASCGIFLGGPRGQRL